MAATALLARLMNSARFFAARSSRTTSSIGMSATTVMGANAVPASNGIFAYRNWLIVRMPADDISSV